MTIKQIYLQNFRNYKAQNFDFDNDKVVFWGQNGQGKTNILEAISVCSVGKSWRETGGKNLCNLIQNNQENPALIELKTRDNNKYQVQIFPNKRVFLKNDKKIPRKNQLGQLPSLLFVPEHLEIFSAPKKSRQSFFDRFLCQIFPEYKNLLTQTLKVVKQKNAILKEDFSPDFLQTQLQPWNDILKKNLPQIWKFRENFLAELTPLWQAELTKITGKNEALQTFLVRANAENNCPPNNEQNYELTDQDFSREIQAKRCFLSPTRDDFSLYFRGQPVMNTVSRGEIRSILLALLSAKKNYFVDKTGKMPLLLLDDCFSELDDNRQQGLENLCQNTQTFFTTTHEEHFASFASPVQKIKI